MGSKHKLIWIKKLKTHRNTNTHQLESFTKTGLTKKTKNLKPKNTNRTHNPKNAIKPELVFLTILLQACQNNCHYNQIRKKQQYLKYLCVYVLTWQKLILHKVNMR